VKRLPFLRRPRGARRILDIGAGHNPFRGATHLLEIDVGEGYQRGWNKVFVPGGAKLIVGDVQDLPFRPGSFDFVYASHVLEHVDRPSDACREIRRVAPAGYIETPGPFLEQGLALASAASPGEGFHKWMVFSPREGLLVFEPKTAETVRDFCSCPDGAFLMAFYASVDFARAQHCFRREAKTTIFHWKGAFDVEVRPGTADCRRDGRPCRFAGMRAALVGSLNDPFRFPRILRLRKDFPAVIDVLRKHGHGTPWRRPS